MNLCESCGTNTLVIDGLCDWCSLTLISEVPFEWTDEQMDAEPYVLPDWCPTDEMDLAYEGDHIE